MSNSIDSDQKGQAMAIGAAVVVVLIIVGAYFVFSGPSGEEGEGGFIIEGYEGTTPDPRVTGPAYEEFKAAYSDAYGEDPTTFCSNTYDAVNIVALAIQEAGTVTDGSIIKQHVFAVANPPGVEVDNVARALELLRQDNEINYQGASGEITFDDVGDVFGKYCKWSIENGDVALGDPIAVGAAAGGGVRVIADELPSKDENVSEVKLGMLMPLSGGLSEFGGPMRDGGMLALEDINQAGGILNDDNIDIVLQDTETSESAANNAASNLIELEGVPVIIGPAGSGTSMAIMEKSISNDVVQISPSATSPDFTTYSDNGYFFRTCPTDALQGKAMAKVAKQNEYETASTLVLNNDYGVGFEEVFKEEFEGEILHSERYDPKASTFKSTIQNVAKDNPDVIMLVSYPETGSIILKRAYQLGVMESSDWLLSEGLRANDLAEMVGKKG